jgi:hypothetical protein
MHNIQYLHSVTFTIFVCMMLYVRLYSPSQTNMSVKYNVIICLYKILFVFKILRTDLSFLSHHNGLFQDHAVKMCLYKLFLSFLHHIGPKNTTSPGCHIILVFLLFLVTVNCIYSQTQHSKMHRESKVLYIFSSVTRGVCNRVCPRR